MRPLPHLPLAAALALGHGTAGCRAAPRAPSPAPMCAVTLEPSLRHVTPDSLPAATWYGLLIRGYDGSAREDAVDCAGEVIAWRAAPRACGELDGAARVAARGPVRDDELILRHAGGAFWFAWAPLWRLDNGMAEGPLAIAHRAGDRLEARAIGTLRGYTGRARIEVRRLERAYIVSVEGEHCAAPDRCARAVRLAYLDRQRIVARPLRSAGRNECVGPAWFPLDERITQKLDARWERELRRDLSVAYEDDAVVIDERISVHDRDLHQRELPPRLFREVQSRMRVTVEQGELVTEGQSLWRSVRIEDASLEASRATDAL